MYPHPSEPPKRVRKRAEWAKDFFRAYLKEKEGKKVFAVGHSMFFRHFTGSDYVNDQPIKNVYMENCQILPANEYL